MAVYVVKLRDNRFYVGYTSDFRKRLNQHLKGKSSEWVKKFKLASNPVYKIYETEEKIDELFHFIEMVKIFGVQNVRGAQFSAIKLSEKSISTIKILETYEDLRLVICEKCGLRGHDKSICENK